MKKLLWKYILHAYVCVTLSSALKILGVFPTPSRSHFVMYEALMNALLNKGHHITVVSHYARKTSHPRYEDISIKDSTESLDENVSASDLWESHPFEAAFDLFKHQGRDLCASTFRNPSLQTLKSNSPNFDIVIVEVYGTDCMLGFGQMFGAPTIGISATSHLPWAFDRMGNPDNPSYIENYFIPRNRKMILWYKMEKVFMNIISKIGYYMLSTIPSEMRAREYFGENLSPLDYLAYNTSLLLLNTHFSLTEPKPLVPNVVEVGGLHLDQRSNQESFLFSSPKPIIYFSMGTSIKLNSIPTNELKHIMKTFANLKDYIIYMKADKKSLNVSLPLNVHLKRWLPQTKILCHPNTKLFITNGGLLSLQETAYCGVPIVGIPITADQILNIKTLELKKSAVLVDFDRISSDFESAVISVLSNQTFKNNAIMLSKKFKDRPMSALDTAIYWVEYVARYKGAPHLRTLGADLIWFEYYSLDVAIVYFLIGMVFLYLCVLLLNFLQNYFDAPNEPPKKKL